LSLVLCITLLAAAPLRAAALTPEQLLEATLGSAIPQPTRAEVARSPANRRAAMLLASPDFMWHRMTRRFASAREPRVSYAIRSCSSRA
jgi:hypothetical protein